MSTFFKYPTEIRHMIYTTNCMENYNRQIHKVIKTKSPFPSDEALMKIIYLATMDIIEKWKLRKTGVRYLTSFSYISKTVST